jgi:hypothetical protein
LAAPSYNACRPCRKSPAPRSDGVHPLVDVRAAAAAASCDVRAVRRECVWALWTYALAACVRMDRPCRMRARCVRACGLGLSCWRVYACIRLYRVSVRDVCALACAGLPHVGALDRRFCCVYVPHVLTSICPNLPYLPTPFCPNSARSDLSCLLTVYTLRRRSCRRCIHTSPIPSACTQLKRANCTQPTGRSHRCIHKSVPTGTGTKNIRTYTITIMYLLTRVSYCKYCASQSFTCRNVIRLYQRGTVRGVRMYTIGMVGA